ncbi:hypothetical protein KJ567_05110 [Candidatus Bipolaricaulota bacterium]|nr:hypothetical protein [Candidatus Bipolaricaulota bacterium]
MSRIMAFLLTCAALLLSVPAIVAGSYGYAVGVLAILATGVAIQRRLPQSRAADLLLGVHAAVAAVALLVGVHPAFAVVALCLYLFAWDIGHRLGHTQRAAVAKDAARRFVASTLVRVIVPSLAIGLMLTGLLYVRFPLTFGLGLVLSVVSLLLIAGFIRVASSHYRKRP